MPLHEMPFQTQAYGVLYSPRTGTWVFLVVSIMNQLFHPAPLLFGYQEAQREIWSLITGLSDTFKGLLILYINFCSLRI